MDLRTGNTSDTTASTATVAAIPVEAHRLARFVTQSLNVARDLLGMEVAWIAEFRDDMKIFAAVEGDGVSFGIADGGSVPLDRSYCARVARGELPKVVPHTSVEPAVRVTQRDLSFLRAIGRKVAAEVEERGLGFWPASQGTATRS